MANLKLTELSSSKCFDGFQKVFSHDSEELKWKMKFGVFIPANSEATKLNVLYWLSGYLCSENTFIKNSGAQRYASEHNILLVNPDTIPRNCEIEGKTNDLPGCYLDATENNFKNNFRTYSYVTKELPQIIEANFNVTSIKSIFGHSLGGHGALLCALKNPGLYKSVSALAPMLGVTLSKMGRGGLTLFLGPDRSTWEEYDAIELVKKYNGPELNILIDLGMDDVHLSKEIFPEPFLEAVKNNKQVKLTYRMQEGYDHSYYFVSSFMEDHFNFHKKIQLSKV